MYKVKRVSCSAWKAWAVYIVKNRTTLILSYFDMKVDAVKRAQVLNTQRPTTLAVDAAPISAANDVMALGLRH